MIAGVYNITCDQGATFERIFTLYPPGTDPTNPGDTAPVDLSGYHARMQVRRRQDASDTLIDLTTENGRITLGGAAGTVRLYLTPAETAAITQNGVYDLELVASGGAVERMVKGEFRLSREVTR